MEDFTYNHHDDASDAAAAAGNNHGWQKVTYAKRRKNQPQQNKAKAAGAAEVVGDNDGNVFRAIEQQSEERHRRIVEAQKKAAALSDAPQKPRSKRDDSDYGESDEERENGVVVEEKGENKEKKKKKAEKKPKISVSDAASKIGVDDLAAFLADVSGSYESQEDIQLMRFADYFGRAFAGVSAAQFPWVKTFKESPVAKIAEIPLSQIPDAVHRTSVDWINQRSVAALSSFVLLLLDSILADLGNQLSSSAKNPKKATQQPSSKSQVAQFVVLAMLLRRKPDVLISLLPTLRENSKYQGQDKLPLIIWMISQASQGDLAVGLYAWAHNLLPMLNSKSSNNPLTRDLILQLIERILAAPKSRSILVNGAVRKGERLIPPAQLEILMRVTFPMSAARVKATERFEAVYPTLKEVALAGAPGSKAMKQVSQQIFGFAVTAAGEGNPELSKEATNIALWCLKQNVDIYKHWDKVYLDNLQASVAILKKLSEEWREQHVNPSSIELVKQTMKNFQQKNEKALAGDDSGKQSLLREADKYCKVLMGRLSRGHGCLKAFAFVVVALGVGAAVMSPNIESFDLKRLSVMLNSFQSV
uniref:Transmembrane protein 214-A n=1 Tax=Opuntia streptacantha TaxID=393608 RepID=A0A7C9CEU4_OPUST